MSQCIEVKGFKEKEVSGWSMEEMKEKPHIAVEEDNAGRTCLEEWKMKSWKIHG